MSFIDDLFGDSPFGPIVEHSKKVQECIALLSPLFEALVAQNYDEIRRLQQVVAQFEDEADAIRNMIRRQLINRSLLPVDKGELLALVRYQDKIAGAVEDFAVILTLRETPINPTLQPLFSQYLGQVIKVSQALLTAAEEIENLVETAFSGAEAAHILLLIQGLGEQEDACDKTARHLSREIFKLADNEEILNILFYEKMVIKLGQIANQAENGGEHLQNMLSEK